mmetsp:Transcript_22091/g.48475  ORF Transcript_22091/g.48475 Transcript_22091/m.48475 type:complete len:144 (-) Transcript_22091:188-619(-)
MPVCPPTSKAEATMKIMKELRVPKSASEFERIARQLLESPPLLATYVKLLAPDKYASFFKVSMEAVHLTAIATALNDPSFVSGDVERTVATLRALTKVNRFDMALMLLPKKDKTHLHCVFEALKAAPQVDAADLAGIRKHFKL